MIDLTDLITRLEGATGPDREIDAEIAVALSDDPDAWVVNPSPQRVFSGVPGCWTDGPHKIHLAPEYTASLDAALSLVAEKLPGSMWRIGFDPDDGSMKAEFVTAAPECRRVVANHDTPALAVCLALLRALQSGAAE